MRQAWEHANDENVSIPTSIVSLFFFVGKLLIRCIFHMFHTNIKHELCLHGGMVLEKAKMGVGGPSVRASPNLVVSITSMDGSGHSESMEHPQVQCFSQIT